MPKKMKVSLEEKFLAIAEEAIEKADSVECSREDFVDGLGLIVSELETRFENAQEENEKA